jgi:hypothetical protein
MKKIKEQSFITVALSFIGGSLLFNTLTLINLKWLQGDHVLDVYTVGLVVAGIAIGMYYLLKVTKYQPIQDWKLFFGSMFSVLIYNFFNLYSQGLDMSKEAGAYLVTVFPVQMFWYFGLVWISNQILTVIMKRFKWES